MGVSERPPGAEGRRSEPSADRPPGEHDHTQPGEHDHTRVGELIQIALADTDPDGPARWQAITMLQERGDLETFTVARRLCGSATAAERVLGVDILGELGRDRPFAHRTLPVLRYLAASESDPHVLYSLLIAFGHLRDRRALPSVIELSGHEHPTVRYGAAYALPHVIGDPPDPAGLAALRRLAGDQDNDVADWASLGLALWRQDSAPGGELDDLRRQILDP